MNILFIFLQLIIIAIPIIIFILIIKTILKVISNNVAQNNPITKKSLKIWKNIKK